MKKILIIPDVHGRTFWKEAIKTDDYSKIIFLGDYVDPYQWEGIDERRAVKNFKEILKLKKQQAEKVILLLGNHDMCYYSDRYRQYGSSDRYMYRYEKELQDLYKQNKSFFKLAHEETIGERHYLFSHAGITQPWLKHNLEIIGEPDADHLNQLLESDAGIDTLTEVGFLRGGLYPTGSLVWADIDELVACKPIPGICQVVGHSLQLYGPVITDHIACLDCRAGFSIDETGVIVPVTKIIPYEKCI